jgi:hypothetical protein
MTDRALGDTVSRWDLYAFCAWLMWAPLPLASNRTWALAMTLPPLFLLAAIVGWRRAAATRRPFLTWVVGWPGLSLLVFLAVLVVQLVPVDGQTPSFAHHKTQVYALVALGCAVVFWLTTVVVRNQHDLRLLLYGLVACGAAQAVIAVVLMGTHTTLTMLDAELPAGGVATGTFPNRNHLAGYLNLCLAAGIGLLMGQLARASDERTWRQQLRDWLELMLSGKARLRLVLVLLVMAVILTRSRGGNSAFAFGLLVAASIYAITARSRRRGLLWFVASVFVIDVVLIGAWVGVDRVVDRVRNTPLTRAQQAQVAPPASTGTSQAAPSDPATASIEAASSGEEARSAARAAAPASVAPPAANTIPEAAEQSLQERTDPAFDAVAMVRDHPWIGTGGGTFYVAFMGYSERDQGYYSHAHNDYLEIASDTGLLGLGALLALALASAWTALSALRHRRNPMVRAAAFATLMALAGMALHSVVEFSLQIPAVSMMFCVMLALPFAAQVVPSRRARTTRSASAAGAHSDDRAAAQGREQAGGPSSATGEPAASGRRRPGAWPQALHRLSALAATVLFAWASLSILRQGLAEYLAIEAAAAVSQWESGAVEITPGGIAQVLEILSRASKLAPENAEFHETRGSALFARAMLPARDDAQRRADLEAAADAYRDALRHARASGYTWGSLAMAKRRIDAVDAEFEGALRNAARLGPYEPSVQVMVLGAGLSAWNRLSVDTRREVADAVRRGWTTNRDRLIAEAATATRPEWWCGPTATVASPPEVAEVMNALCVAMVESAQRP